MDRPQTELAGLDSPVEPLTVIIDGEAISGLRWGAAPSPFSDLGRSAVAQLTEYFGGNRRAFDLPLAPRASAFQARFYDALCAIPFGETRTYGDIAADLGVSAQAIGQACGANPIPILIPCHRVLATNSLGGFSGGGGIEAKVALLRLEGAAGLLI